MILGKYERRIEFFLHAKDERITHFQIWIELLQIIHANNTILLREYKAFKNQ